MISKKARGYDAENVALDDYLQHGRVLVQKNFTIPGGELDLILLKDGILNFVEVKDVSRIDDLSGYITLAKRKHIKNTIHTFLYKVANNRDQPRSFHYDRIRCDVVFVKNKKIYTVVQDCVDF